MTPATTKSAIDSLAEARVFGVGDTMVTKRTSINSNWLLCNGSLFSKEQYPALAALYPTSSFFTFNSPIIRVNNLYAQASMYGGNAPILVWRNETTGTGLCWMNESFTPNSVTASTSLSAMAYANGKWYVLFSATGTAYNSNTSNWILWTSTNGLSWSKTNIAGVTANGIVGMAVNGNNIVLTGSWYNSTYAESNAAIWYSSDRVSFSKVRDAGNETKSHNHGYVFYDGSRYITTYYHGGTRAHHLLASSDGVTWSDIGNLGTSNTFTLLASENGVTFASDNSGDIYKIVGSSRKMLVDISAAGYSFINLGYKKLLFENRIYFAGYANSNPSENGRARISIIWVDINGSHGAIATNIFLAPTNSRIDGISCLGGHMVISCKNYSLGPTGSISSTMDLLISGYTIPAYSNAAFYQFIKAK